MSATPSSISGLPVAEPSGENGPAVHQSPKKKKRKKETTYTKSDEEVWDIDDSEILGAKQLYIIPKFDIILTERESQLHPKSIGHQAATVITIYRSREPKRMV
jgi:hypothetical protein